VNAARPVAFADRIRGVRGVVELPPVEVVDGLARDALVDLLTRLGALTERARARLPLLVRTSGPADSDRYLDARSVTIPVAEARGRVTDRYLRTAEVATRLGMRPKTLRNKLAAGIFREGEHFFRLPGVGRLWKWEAVVTSVESGHQCTQDQPVIPLARPGIRRAT